MKGPKLVHRHRFQIIRFLFLNPDDLPPAVGCQKVHLGDSFTSYHEWKTPMFKKEHFNAILRCYRAGASS